MTENEVKQILYTMRLAAGLDDFEKPNSWKIMQTKKCTIIKALRMKNA